MPSTRAAKPKVITQDGEEVADTGAQLAELGDPPLEAPPIPDDLIFHSDEEAAKEREEDPGTPFQFDGKRYVAYRPKDAVMVTLLAAGSMNATMADQVQACLQWLDHCLDPIAKMELQRRIYDREDHLEWEDLAAIMTGLLHHWEKDETSREERREALKIARREQALDNARGPRTRAAAASGNGRAGRAARR